jgi:flagellin-specific chaperone FliS
MTTRLIEANAMQTDAPLAEVERLLFTLLEAWSAVPETEPTSASAPEAYEPLACAY